MGVKLLLALLTVMLVILLVFNAFNIAYAPNDFMGTMLTVENGLGQVSDFALKAFDKVKEFVLSGADLLGSIYDATLGKFVKWIEKTFLFDMLKEVVTSVSNWMKENALIFDFFGEYGFNFFDKNYRSELKLFISCIDSSEFYSDFDTRKGFDMRKFEKYRDAYLYGASNEFSYLLGRYLEKNFTDYVRFAPLATVISDYKLNPLEDISFEDCDLWFTTVDLKIPDDYCTFLSRDERAERYFSDVVPVYDSNYSYTYKTYDCTLTGIILKPYDGFDGLLDDWDDTYTFKLNEKYYSIDLVFSYIAGADRLTHNVVVSYGEYAISLDLGLYPNCVQYLDYNAT